MIITVAKPLDEVLKNIQPYTRIFVVGCGACATKCQTGDEEAVKKMVLALEAAGKTVTGSLVMDTACDMRLAKRDIAKSVPANDAEVIVMLACGAGTQAVGTSVDKPVTPGLNPVFVGTTERIGVYRQFCAVCGDCMLEQTAGVCAVSRCAKGLVNGPCGGVIDGKCEVDSSRDCAWALMYERQKKRGKQVDALTRFIAPRNVHKPKEIIKGKL
ncbi:MAG: methylenetetrahydrofolate reductase C-terminal domain-containing protein [Elusimicrobia bacterium]|nr:methylenetetrahydrofolate reductase C-terminal domain-containing protein [Elusimicrobiota bacterium]